jgi:hypothetical protein
MTRLTLPRSLPWAARSEAAPRVGPTQGLQIAPSSRPSENCPASPLVLKPPSRLDAQSLTGPPAIATRVCRTGIASTAPMAIIRLAATTRKKSPSSPIEKPMTATKVPIAVKESATPVASAAGPQRCSDVAAPRTIGSIGSTHGDSVDRSPATKPSRTLPSIFLEAPTS